MIGEDGDMSVEPSAPCTIISLAAARSGADVEQRTRHGGGVVRGMIFDCGVEGGDVNKGLRFVKAEVCYGRDGWSEVGMASRDSFHVGRRRRAKLFA